MELTNVELETYEVLGNRLGISREEFAGLPIIERCEWVEACRVARILNENKPDELYEGYYMTDMFDEDGCFSLVDATDIVRNKKKAMDVVKRYVDFTGSLPQFVLLGDKGTDQLINEALKEMNNETARLVNEGRVLSSDEKFERENDRSIIERARKHMSELKDKITSEFKLNK